MKRHIKYYRLVLMFVFGMIAFSAVSQQLSTIQVEADSTAFVVGSPVHLKITVKKPFAQQVVLPVVTDSIVPAIGVIADTSWDTIRHTDSMVVLQKKMIISAYDSGQIVLPPLPLILQNIDTVADTLYSDSLIFQVRLLPVDTVRPHLADIKPPLNTPFNFEEFKALYLPKILIGLGILLLLGLAYYYYRKYRQNHIINTHETQKKQVKPEEAHLIALEKLNLLKEKKLWQHDKVKEYYTELIDIFREYIENRYRMPAMEKTSDDILHDLLHFDQTREYAEPLTRLLPLSDLAKFAKYKPLPDENETALKTVIQFIEQTCWQPEKSENQNDNELNKQSTNDTTL